MLKPAILYKSELEKCFEKELYTDEYYFYSGYAHCNSLPEIKVEDNKYQYAMINDENKVIGYLAYTIQDDCACNFGLYSFDKGNPIVGKDLFEKMEELVKICRRIEWKMIGGNSVKKHYDKFCKKHNGNCVVLHDVCKDKYGNYHDEYIYEILSNKNLNL